MVNCQKIPYQTKAEAKADAEFMRAQKRHFTRSASRGAKNGRKLRVYKCRWCDAWHLTTRKK